MVRGTTNPHFQLYEHDETQRLYDDLVAETIEVHGYDCYYLPRRRVDFDPIYYEDAQSKFDTAYQIPLYIKSWQGFQGTDAMMTHFGIKVQLQLILTMARIHWENNIGSFENPEGIWRPQEGDLIYIPKLDYHVYEIKFVDEHPYFYQHGYENQYDLTVELWRYAGEILNTGIEEVDCLQKTSSLNSYDWAITTEAGLTLTTEDGLIIELESRRDSQAEHGIIEENDLFQTEAQETPNDGNTANDLITWDTENPFAEGDW